MKRIERWREVFLWYPKRVSGTWHWFSRVMRKGDQYIDMVEYEYMTDHAIPDQAAIDKLTPYADEILAEIDKENSDEQHG